MQIEQHAPELERLISPGQAMEQLADGFGGPGGLGPGNQNAPATDTSSNNG